MGKDGVMFALVEGIKIGPCCSCTLTKLFLLILSLVWLMLPNSLLLWSCPDLEDVERALVAIVGTTFGECPTVPWIGARLPIMLKLLP